VDTQTPVTETAVEPATRLGDRGASVLEARGLSCGYGDQIVLADVDIQLIRGETVAVLGRNGSGKSTLLRALAGALPPLAGCVIIGGVRVSDHDRRALARRLAVVSQALQVPFAFSVREVVELGRAPYARFLAPSSAKDERAVRTALDLCDLDTLEDRTFQHLSGGEQQRVALAMALAQEPEILLLDEPTMHLDLAHQMSFLALVRRLSAERGLAVMAAMHDINLSALYFDRLLVLGEGALAASGTPAEVVSAALVEHAFGTRVAVHPHPTAAVPQIVLLP
jgi:iron complex transport system ATP-binding protein